MSEIDKKSAAVVRNSWEFFEFCEKESHGKTESKEEREKHMPAFFRKEMDTVKNLKEASKECQTTYFGFIREIFHKNKMYFLDISELNGNGAGLHIPNELFALGKYKPKEGDKISYVADNKRNISFSIRENGLNKEIFSINRDSEEYKNIMREVEKRKQTYTEDKLETKEKYLNKASEGLSGEEKDKARLEASHVNAIIEDKFTPQLAERIIARRHRNG